MKMNKRRNLSEEFDCTARNPIRRGLAAGCLLCLAVGFSLGSAFLVGFTFPAMSWLLVPFKIPGHPDQCNASFLLMITIGFLGLLMIIITATDKGGPRRGRRLKVGRSVATRVVHVAAPSS